MKFKINKKIIEAVALLVIPVVLFYTMEWFLRNPFEKMRVSAQVLNILFFELGVFFLFFVVGSARIAIRIEAVIAMLVGLINYFVVQFRSNPVQPWDIFSIKTAAVVADNYKYSLEKHAMVCLGIFALIIIGTFLVPKREKIRKKVRIGGSVVLFLLLIFLTI